MSKNWLVIYYNGNENLPALVRGVSEFDIGQHLLDKMPSEWMVNACVELHPSYLDQRARFIDPAIDPLEWNPIVYVEGDIVWRIRDLPDLIEDQE